MIALFDAHCDTITRIHAKGEMLRRNTGHWDGERARSFAPCAQFFAIYGEPFDDCYPFFLAQMQAHQEMVSFCRNAKEAEQAAQAGKLAAFLSIEGAEAIHCDESRLREIAEKGVRMISLTWNHINRLSGSNAQDADKGLTKEGRAFVQTLKPLPVLLDVSHLSDPGFWDVADLMEGRPFVASHSNARAVTAHRRNLTDEQFAALVRSGGFVGVNLYAPFLSQKPQPGWDDVYAHMDHFWSLGGENTLGLGCDLDGCDDLPAGLTGVDGLHALYAYLLARRVPEALLQKFFYANLLGVVKAVCDM